MPDMHSCARTSVPMFSFQRTAATLVRSHVDAGRHHAGEPMNVIHRSLRAWLLPIMLLLVTPVIAQTPSPQDRAAAIKQSLAQNQAALRQYTWIETTEISLKGEVKKQEQKQCSYG